jgi:hypothetical protein
MALVQTSLRSMVSSTKIPNYPQSYPQDVEMRGL